MGERKAKKRPKKRRVKVRCGEGKYLLTLKASAHAADDDGKKLDEDDVDISCLTTDQHQNDEASHTCATMMRFQRIGTRCPIHTDRRLSTQQQTDVWPFSHRPSCCVSASGARCGVSTGLMYRCGKRSVNESTGVLAECSFGLCEKHYQGSASDALIAKQLELLRFIEEHGITIPLAAAVLFISNAMFMPFVKTALMMLSCHPYMQCLLPQCWAAPNQEFILAAYLSAVVVVTVGTAVPIVLAFLLWRRRSMLSPIFFCDVLHVGLRDDRNGLTELSPSASVREWSRFTRSDYSALSSLYRELRFKWIFTTPLLLMWKGIYLVAPLVMEPGSFNQVIGVAVTEAVFALFVYTTSPSPSHIANAVFRLGSVHQLMLLGLLSFDTYTKFQTGVDYFFMPMIVVTVSYLAVCGAFIVFNSLQPILFSLKRQKLAVRLAMVGVQFSETTNLYRIEKVVVIEEEEEEELKREEDS